MFKLFFLVILFLNLHLICGPSMPSKKTFPSLTKIFQDYTGFKKLSEIFKHNQPPSKVDTSAVTPEKEVTKEITKPINYLPLVVIVDDTGIYLPWKIFSYLESSQSVSENTLSKISFFCPINKSPENSCLLPTNHRKCTTEARPVIKAIMKTRNDVIVANSEKAQHVSEGEGVLNEDESTSAPLSYHARCGPTDKGYGYLYSFSYELCLKTDSNNAAEKRDEPEVEEFELYNFCYDHDKKETIYTQHLIYTPELLFDERLKKEQEMTFTMSTDAYKYFGDDFKAAKKAYSNLDSINTNNAQKLVPPEDFAFAVWKIPTFHYANMRPQHKDLMILWDHIGELIRNSSATQHKTSFLIYTGAYKVTEDEQNVKYVFESNIQIPELWVKLVLKEEDNEEPSFGLAILMNNDAAQETPIELDKYCKKNHCDYSGKKIDIFKSFTSVGHMVRCCQITDKILKLFNLDTVMEAKNISMLTIDNLNGEDFEQIKEK